MKALALAMLFAAAPDPGYWDGMKAVIQQHLGRPYVWGSTGLKSFDCSGFVWRVLYDNGILIKRTTARKLYMSLKPVSPNEQWQGGNIVFFDNMKHCGIVNARDTFFHAESRKGTNLSHFQPYWGRKVCGFRKLK
ncbi:MAG TPA: NlpC/P60 family protein [Bryobacteraceae bacterium]|nr:NlpC/P60 family protein [Bryobacteraceae bacterium]